MKVKLVGTVSSTGPYAAYDAETGAFVAYCEADGEVVTAYQGNEVPVGTKLEVVEKDESAWD